MSTNNKTKIRLNINRKSKCIRNFPSIPPKWKERLDVNVWNELSDACNVAISEALVPSKTYRSVIITSSCFGFWTLLATILLITAYTKDNYDCNNQWHCQWDESYCLREFISSMTFYGIAVILFIIMTVYYSCFQKAEIEKQSKTVETYIDYINEKYKNLIVFKLLQMNTTEYCRCCRCCEGYLELEIELKVQKVTFVEDINRLPTQQEIMVQNGHRGYQKVELCEPESTVTIDEFREMHHTQWTHINVLQWIMSLDNGIFKEYEQKLTETLKAEEIDGNDIFDLDKDDLHRLGVQKFKLKKLLLTHIKSLRQAIPAYNNNDVVIQQNENGNLINVQQDIEGGVSNC